MPKWPAIVVTGDKVAPDQADEINIRTDGFYLSANDKEWSRQVCEAFGVSVDKHGYPEWESTDKARERFGILSLEYLNNFNIISCYVGGPHGWCRWDGTIFYSGHNIGKWPSCEDVGNEWALIAKTWPFLKLRCQLFNAESCGENLAPVVEYHVENGECVCRPPGAPMQVVPDDMESSVRNLLFNPMRERGVSLERLRKAIKTAEESLAKTKNPAISDGVHASESVSGQS